MYALSTPKEITPTAALRAAKRGRKADPSRPVQPEFAGITGFWFGPRGAGIRRLTSRQRIQGNQYQKKRLIRHTGQSGHGSGDRGPKWLAHLLIWKDWAVTTYHLRGRRQASPTTGTLPVLLCSSQRSLQTPLLTRTRTNTNPNDTEANAAGRSGNARALRKQSKCGVYHEGEGHWPNFSQKL